MAYQRKTRTAEELSMIRSKAAKSRKSHKGGRPPLPEGQAKRVSNNIGLHAPAYHVIKTLAFASHKTVADFMDIVAESLKKKNPKHFPAE